jgi:hypothetical protein
MVSPAEKSKDLFSNLYDLFKQNNFAHVIGCKLHTEIANLLTIAQNVSIVKHNVNVCRYITSTDSKRFDIPSDGNMRILGGCCPTCSQPTTENFQVEIDNEPMAKK